MEITIKHKIKSFKDLDAWREAHQLVLEIYKITRTFPKEERYCLIDQLKRCAISVSSNIAEGFSRRGTKEKMQFYFMAKGSLTELQNQLLIARDVGYFKSGEFTHVAEKTVAVHKLINGLIKASKLRCLSLDTKF